MQVFTLSCRGWTAAVAPANGAAILGFDNPDGVEVLRRGHDPEGLPQSMGCFPMVPFWGRIPDRTFEWNGRRVTLAPNLADGGVAHGFGWKAPWRTDVQSTSSLELSYSHPKGLRGWPWSFEATLKIDLVQGKLGQLLRVVNTDVTPMPAAVGFHPYLPAAPGAVLAGGGGHGYDMDAAGQPSKIRLPVPDRMAVDQARHSLTTSGTRLVLEDRHTARRLTASTDRWVLYRPPGAPLVCLEPVIGAAPSRWAGAGGMGFRGLEPGCTRQVQLSLSLGPL
ncbi:hypothetical protein [Brevundimonas sp.]|uniref:aldose epimerase family protein n=1 Tax=Brevundimonas sp. TaxID=1871086 RepID=UPI00286D1E7F|nr:hypothetical protein [Brevundimonas sp.]